MKVLCIVLYSSQTQKQLHAMAVGGRKEITTTDPPAAPSDIFLCRYGHRVRRKKGRCSQTTTLNKSPHWFSGYTTK